MEYITREEKDALVKDLQFLMDIPPTPCSSCFVGYECCGCPPYNEWKEKYGKKVKEKGLEDSLYNIFRIKKIEKEMEKLQKEWEEICRTDSLIRSTKDALRLYYK